MSHSNNEPINFVYQLKLDTKAVLENLYTENFAIDSIQVVETKAEFAGDYSVVIFGLAKKLQQAPETFANTLGNALVNTFNAKYISFEIIKGFVNITLSNNVLLQFIQESAQVVQPKKLEANAKVMVEFSSPNTNKPLHFGHLRNIFLGASVSKILHYAGYEVIKTNLLNDRGIHICKSMHAWMADGEKATPENTGKKGDHLVGDFYVQFENKMKAEAQIILEEILQNNLSQVDVKQKETTQKLLENYNAADNATKANDIKSKILEIAKHNTVSMQGTRKLLMAWENNDTKTKAIWKKLNAYVIEGFSNTYKKLGIEFDKYYYESETYLLGKKLVENACSKNILFKKEDNSIWIDLTNEGHDQKLLLRGDGTSVYMTQDIGTSKLKHDDYQMDKSIFVIADEQNYHMQVLQKTLAKMQEPCAPGIQHLSYGMVELPSGRMKTREGNVVDADDMITEMVNIAAKHTLELGKTDGFTELELQNLYNTIGIGALKFYLLRVDPKKKMIFNPEESIDFHGFTGPFIQYTFARINSILNKAEISFTQNVKDENLLPLERKLTLILEQFYDNIFVAAKELNPSIICNYVFNVAKTFNGLIAELKILTAETEQKKQLRINLCIITKQVIENCLQLLGINAPTKM
jgi:arginyl-tRNA synthetase